jgi:hypothetical protein
MCSSPRFPHGPAHSSSMSSPNASALRHILSVARRADRGAAGGPALVFHLVPAALARAETGTAVPALAASARAVYDRVRARVRRPAVRAVGPPCIAALADAQAFALARAGPPRVRFDAPTEPTPAPPDALDARARLCVGYAHSANGRWLLVAAEDGRGDARRRRLARAVAGRPGLARPRTARRVHVRVAVRRSRLASSRRSKRRPRRAGVAWTRSTRSCARASPAATAVRAVAARTRRAAALRARDALVRGSPCPTAGRCCSEALRGFVPQCPILGATHRAAHVIILLQFM